MAEFVVAVSDPDAGQTYQQEVSGQDANRFVGREIGDEIDGEAVDLPGYTVTITGGSDDTGRPMHGEVEGRALAEIMSDGGTGFNPTRDGERRRVTVRGREIGDATRQINVSIAEYGDQPAAVLIGDAEPEDVEEETEADEAEGGEEEEVEDGAEEEAEDETEEEPENEAEEEPDDEAEEEEAEEAEEAAEDSDEATAEEEAADDAENEADEAEADADETDDED